MKTANKALKIDEMKMGIEFFIGSSFEGMPQFGAIINQDKIQSGIFLCFLNNYLGLLLF